MTCPKCKTEMKRRHRINKEVTGLAYSYYYCPKCGETIIKDKKE